MEEPGEDAGRPPDARVVGPTGRHGVEGVCQSGQACEKHEVPECGVRVE